MQSTSSTRLAQANQLQDPQTTTGSHKRAQKLTRQANLLMKLDTHLQGTIMKPREHAGMKMNIKPVDKLQYCPNKGFKRING